MWPWSRAVTRSRHSRLGLRTRVTITFALGAFTLSTALGAITYFTTRSSILHQENSALASEAYANADTLRPNLTSYTSAADTLSNIDTVSGSESFLVLDGSPIEIHFDLRQANIPTALFELATRGTPASETFRLDGVVSLAIGVPIPADNATYFEVFSLAQTARTLQIILASLVVAGLVTTIAGTVLGRWAAARALRPLRDVSEAALAIASGRLDTRLQTDDVRDLALLASSFNRMVDRLQQRIERDARFTSDVSHELRSPLTTLAASLSVLESRRDELPDRSKQALDLLAAEIRRFQRMVGDLLEISRLDAGSADFDTALVEVGSLVRNAVASTRAVVPIDISTAVASRLLLVDKRRFERIMANLIENASRYAGGATRVAVVQRDDVVRVSVEDEGPGVRAEERTRIFERFARGSVAAGSRGAGGGTGLGLALVAEHVKLHGGKVWAEGRPAGGARFVVELPLSDELSITAEHDAAGVTAGERRG